ncbi:MAG: NAD(P)/FAD-dependent oxidoreductase [Novosphingobium sp.]|nr:NAD(P)/FAD-dependent oxidoreductase [Novosphingobium sp.]MCP5403496.1 NAD(P)/FAD-dependent oxidoreductase [Novosphingobium sp.]
MICEMTNVPAADEIDIPALKAKYREERAKRMRNDAQKQYAPPADPLTHDTIEHDPYNPVVPRDAIHEDLDVAILGGGWTGVCAAVHLRNAGVENFRNIDHAGDFGGTWYWNRYPGLQCDNDAYCYLPLLEETNHVPSKQFEDGYLIFDHFQRIAKQYDLYENALFHTLITSLIWDEDIKRWRISTNRGDEIRARFVVMGTGTLNTPKFPSIPGLHTFKGKMFHTSRWDYDYTGGSWRNPVLDKLKDKRVAILGTGATSIQAVPYLAKYAKHVYVIQRTPSSVDERRNRPTDPEWVKSLKPGWQQERRDNFQRASNEIIIPGEGDLVQDIWTEINNNLDAEREARGEAAIPMEEFPARREVMEFRVMERLRRRVDEIVKDPVTAEALKPYYNFLCKRPVSNNEYYPAFNQPNVDLIDVAETQGLEAMTENGFMHRGKEYEIDCMIFASGYEVTSNLKTRWGFDAVTGRDGVSIYDFWADGPKTLHGVMAHNFPNMFFTGYVQGGLNGTTTLMFSKQGYHASYVIAEALKRGIKAVEPTQEAQDAYIQRFREVELDLTHIFETCPPSYFTNEGETNAPWFLFRGWGLGWDNFQTMLQDWRDEGSMEGMRLDS